MGGIWRAILLIKWSNVRSYKVQSHRASVYSPLDSANNVGGSKDEGKGNAVAHQDASQEHVA